ncbi:TPMT family class I SAM-dependent methyltransferase [Psychroserpens ponticola]|uniref:TPMT family class I SAM-dependent methyltransferase n=1 Tax=Psychroserpens ponticola TaxID=2932268 RepID=A0ABY7S1X3_9FLAO|nr:TPMT family class I SAM-dependent methyltransferase [Psychroserpens ponticola]WCO03386.1 TPMT family class I SAM-dependent methyltransferase [Psychroserpens ponticola]
MKIFNESYWDNRYKSQDIGWDLGEISKPLKAYIDQLNNKSIKILIPGGGNSYEAEYIFKKGFENVFVVDLSKTALDNVLNRVPEFPKHQLIQGNFFDLEQTFDLIIEQTFFCALHPSLRFKYVAKMNNILSDKGKLVGLLFNMPLCNDHPPFGGSKQEYLEYFVSCFNIRLMDKAFNSHRSRANKELFFILEKKTNDN